MSVKVDIWLDRAGLVGYRAFYQMRDLDYLRLAVLCCERSADGMEGYDDEIISGWLGPD